MAEKEYIDREALRNELLKISICTDDLYGMGILEGLDRATRRVNNAPAADVVSRSAYDQIRWERDIAMQQLYEAGIPFGGKSDKEYAPVVHGEWDEGKYPFCNVCKECGVVIDRTCIQYNSGKLNYCPNCGARMDGGKHG